MIYTLTLNPALDKTLLATGLEPGTINRAQVLRLDWGGKGINVSRALRNLGQQSTATGFLGGAAGALLEQGLAELNIATAFIRVAGETRTNLTIHDQSRGRLIKLNEAGPPITAQDIATLQDRIRALAAPGDLWVLAGKLPPGAPDKLYASLISLLQGQGACALLDTSGEPLRLGCAAKPYLIKPNRAEAEQLLGRELTDFAELCRALRDLLGLGIPLVLLSLGAEGAMVAEAGGDAFWARPPQVAARSNIGAGDSLLAGFVWATVKGWPLAEAIRWAAAAGTAATLEEGSGVCVLTQVEAIFPHVVARRISL